MNNILFYYASSDVIELFKKKGRGAFEDDDVVGFIYKHCDNPTDSMHYGYDSVYMTKYSKKNDAYVVDIDLKVRDLKEFIENGCIKFDKTESKNQIALKLFESIFPGYFNNKNNPTCRHEVPRDMLSTGIFISKNEWKILKSSGKVPSQLKK